MATSIGGRWVVLIRSRQMFGAHPPQQMKIGLGQFTGHVSAIAVEYALDALFIDGDETVFAQFINGRRQWMSIFHTPAP